MLTQTQILLIPIAAFTAIGDITKLKQVLNVGFDAGLTVNQTKEALVQTYAYAGFPRSLNGLSALMDVLNDRKRSGKNDCVGEDCKPISDSRTMLEIGTEVQTRLVGHPVNGTLFDFVPVIDQFLKSHLFGDIFVRDVLDYPTREVATIAILSALAGLEAQLVAHYQIALNCGLGKDDLRAIVFILNDKVSSEASERAKTALQHLSDN